jgi:hypothetical protein
VISDALNTEAISAAVLGREWAGLMDRALAIALAEDQQAAAGRGLRSTIMPGPGSDPNRGHDPTAGAGEITDPIGQGTFGPIHCQGIRAAV